MKKTPAWLALEKVVAEIQRQLAPQAVVRHNHHVRGQSGEMVKFDVTVSQQVSHCEILIGIECKKKKRPVGSQAVREFAHKLLDVRARGIMISASSFTKDAKVIAAHEHIQLMSYREATDADWKRLLGEQAWIPLTWLDLLNVHTYVILEDRPDLIPVPHGTLILGQGEAAESIRNMGEQLWLELQGNLPLGNVEFGAEVKELSLRDANSNALIPLKQVHFTGCVTASRYLAHVSMTEGQVLEATDGAKKVTRVATTGFDWDHIRKTQPGRLLTPEEFAEFQALRKSGRTFALDPKRTKRFVRLVIATQE